MILSFINPNDPLLTALANAATTLPNPPGEPREQDYRESDEYLKFVEDSVKLCSCDPSLKPCDGVLAHGLCDQINANTEPRGPHLCQDGYFREDDEP